MGKLRVAFTLIGGKSWTGGYNYLLNLVRALDTYMAQSVEPIIFFSDDVDVDEMSPFLDVSGAEVVKSPVFDQQHASRRLIHALVFGRDNAVQRVFRDYRIDCVFEAAQFHGWRSGFPSVAWIPDFQHKCLPGMFGPLAYWKREIGFRAQIGSRRTIMLSSEDSRAVCEKLYRSVAGRIYTVPFAVPMPSNIDEAMARFTADRYGLPESYYILPNQFWRHKNHMLVIDALASLKQKGHTGIVIAATGHTVDPRHPDYFSTLQSRIAEYSLESQFRILGKIPYADLLPLVFSSEALINSSLFEGWSTTVEEAKALGVPMILSDLDVHIEQTEGDARYFDRFSVKALEEALLSPPEKKIFSIEKLSLANEKRMEIFADKFVKTVQHAIQSWGSLN
jgi:glycosyltransferase involved in cell wall biosynthesis